MDFIIKEIQSKEKNLNKKIVFKNNKLNTIVHTTSNIFYKDLTLFSKAFNKLFNYNNKNKNILNVYIINNENIYLKALNYMSDSTLIITKGIDHFNKATSNTSYAKCTNNHNYYLIKCYEYFIYVFDKRNKKCYMIIKNNKKVLTMINILILTPYLMYGELFAVHGGLVNKNNKNILINNSSLGGKTTFAILFASNKWDIITEETTYITKKGEILPYNIRNYFNIRVGTYLNFYDFFKKKGLLIQEFIDLKEKSSNELFKLGKKEQQSIDFNKLGKSKKLKENTITASLKISIQQDEQFSIKKISSLETVNSFLELSLAPTVLLFKELLDFNEINRSKRKNQLKKIFNNTKSYIITSGFDYKEHFNDILNKI